MRKVLFEKSFFMTIFFVIVTAVIVLSGIYIYKNILVLSEESTNKKTNLVGEKVKNDLEVIGNKEDLVYLSVNPGDVLSEKVSIAGSVSNGYFFEGNIIINLLDSDQNVLQYGHGVATTDWMTTKPVSFTASVDTAGFNGSGYIAIEEDDPSGGEGGPIKKILVPVIFNNQTKTLSINLYFPNSVYNKDMLDCSLVYPVSRTIPYTQAIAKASLDELFKGPTNEEKQQGYNNVFPSGSRVNSIKIENNIAYADFNQATQSLGGSCLQASRVSSITTTLKQFPSVKKVLISIEGNANQSEIFQP